MEVKRRKDHGCRLRRANCALCLMILVGGATVVRSQNFRSGSDQSDGALDLSSTPSGTVVNFIPSQCPGDQHALNIFNFTNITIPTGVTVKIQGNSVTAPVIWSASGDVSIAGAIDISGAVGSHAAPILDGRRRVNPGPGGLSGGVGGKYDASASTPQPLAQPGNGPDMPSTKKLRIVSVTSGEGWDTGIPGH
jgi:hypothetical protein